MENIIKTLEKAGLTNKQALVYTALLQTGKATVAEVAKKANVKRTTVYLILEELEIMELVFSSSDKKRVLYTAKDPKSVLYLMFSREKLVEGVMPELSALYSQETGLKTYSCEYFVDNFKTTVEQSSFVCCFFGKQEEEKILNKIKKIIKEEKVKVLINEDDLGSFVVFDNSVVLFPRGNTESVIFIESESFAQTQKMLFESLFNKKETEKGLSFVNIPHGNSIQN